MKANTPFQRLRSNLLLPLQILFLVLVILAIARPFWSGTTGIARSIILIIDASASMKSTDLGETRFEAARSAAAKMVDDLDHGNRAMIIEAASSPKIASGFTSDKLQLKKALDGIRPTDTSTDLNSAFQRASSIARDARKSEIFIFSDGLAKLAPAPEFSSVPTRFIGFGKKDVDNVGITALEIGQSPVKHSERQVFIALQNFGHVGKQAILLELYHDENLIDVRELTLKPGEQRSVVFEVTSEYGEGIIEASINPDDDLSVDDHAYYILSDPGTLQVLLVSAGNRFLDAVIRTASTRIQLSREQPETHSAAGSHDLFVFDGFVPGDLPGADMMFINPGTALPFGNLVSRNDNPTVIDWDSSHPVMRFVDLSDLQIDEVYDYEMPTWMKPLIQSDMGTLAWLGERNGPRIVVLPFEVRLAPSSNFPMLSDFPIFISNALNWLAETDAESARKQVKAGEPLRFSVPDATDQAVIVKRPDGQEVEINSKDGSIVFSNTDRVGIYQIIGKNFVEKFAVNLLDESESNIEPAEKIDVAGQEIASSDVSAVSNKEIWASLVFLALTLLAVEWWVYHRRVLV